MQTGLLDRWEVGGHPLLAQGLAPCLFRAPLDNDLGGSGKTSFAARYMPPLHSHCMGITLLSGVNHLVPMVR